jgi:hypothetical protein
MLLGFMLEIVLKTENPRALDRRDMILELAVRSTEYWVGYQE